MTVEMVARRREGGRGSGMEGPSESQSGRAAEKLRARLAGALARRDQPAVRRLRSAATSVTFRVEGSGSVTILLDRDPPEVATDEEPAEIDILLSDEQAGAFSDGQLPLSMAIVGGEVECRGPVRKYLVVDAILRTILKRAHADADGR